MLAVTLLLVALAVGTNGQEQMCQDGKVWNPCGSPCTKVCWERGPICMEVCQAKCECPADRPYWHALYQKCYTGDDCDMDGLYAGADPPGWGLAAHGGTNSTTMDCSRCMGGACNWDGGCDYGCSDGWYGQDCSMSCSSNCLYAACDNEDGYCSHGCMNGTDGAFCEDYCSKGCYGDWGECEMYDDDGYTVDCSWDQECFDCKCQGAECVYDKPHSSSAPVLISSTLLLLSITLCSMLA